MQDVAPSSTVSSGVETPGGGSGDEAGGGGEGGGGAFDTSALGKRLGRRRPGLGRGGAKPAEPAPKGSCTKDEPKKPKKKASNVETVTCVCDLAPQARAALPALRRCGFWWFHEHSSCRHPCTMLRPLIRDNSDNEDAHGTGNATV